MQRFTCQKCGRVKRVRKLSRYPRSICGYCEYGTDWPSRVNPTMRQPEYRRKKKINRKSKNKRVISR